MDITGPAPVGTCWPTNARLILIVRVRQPHYPPFMSPHSSLRALRVLRGSNKSPHVSPATGIPAARDSDGLLRSNGSPNGHHYH